MPDSAEGEVELPPCAKVKRSNATDRGRMGVYLKGHQSKRGRYGKTGGLMEMLEF